MKTNVKLIQSPILLYTISKVVQKLLLPIEAIELEKIMCQLEETSLVFLEVDNYVLSLDMRYNTDISTILNMIEKTIVKSNKFDLVISTEKLQAKERVLSLSIIQHKLDLLIEKLNIKYYKQDIPESLVTYLKDLEFSTSNDNQKFSKPLALPFFIEPLSDKTLCDAEALRDKTFKNLLKKEKPILEASIQPKLLHKVYIDNEIESMKYWVARDKNTLEIIGLTGIYTEVDDNPEDCWLGWFCLDERYRGKGYGKELLEFSIEQAKRLEKTYLHLYTYDSKEFTTAVRLYNKYQFVKYDVIDSKYKKDLYFKKDLS